MLGDADVTETPRGVIIVMQAGLLGARQPVKSGSHEKRGAVQGVAAE
jgi:hypothetical protein